MEKKKKRKQRNKLTRLVITGVAIFLVIFSLIADLIGYFHFTDTMTASYSDTTESIAKEAATMVDVSALDGFVESNGTSPEFIETHDFFDKLCNNMDAEFIYIVTVADDFSKVNFICEAVNEKSPFDEFPINYELSVTEGEYIQYGNCFRNIIENNKNSDFVIQNKGNIETGYHISSIVSLRDEAGEIKALLVVQKQMDYLHSVRINYIRAIVIATLFLIVIAGVVLSVILRKRLLMPITRIHNEVKRFSAENVLPESKLIDHIKYHDELGSLAFTIDEMEKKTLNYFEELTRVNSEKQRVDAELNLATAIQAAMLPDDFPAFPENDEFDIYATMDPAKEVGGDFYDMFKVDEKHIGVVMADVSGKGVPAALFMAISKTLIKTNAELGQQPCEVFTKVNQTLCENNDAGLFVTAWMGILDIESGVLTYVNAGHNPPMLKQSNDDFEYLRSRPGFVLAGMEGVTYRQNELKINPGDRLFLYTDGVTEATSTDNELYGENRLKDYLNSHKNDELVATLAGLRADIDNFVGEAEQFDDITMLVLEYKKRMQSEE